MHACDDKIPYSSRREAALTMKGSQRRGYRHTASSVIPRPYRCAKCGGWHLGREPSKKDRNRPYFRAAQRYMKRRYGWREEIEDWSLDPLDNE